MQEKVFHRFDVFAEYSHRRAPIRVSVDNAQHVSMFQIQESSGRELAFEEASRVRLSISQWREGTNRYLRGL
jgi:hypothetical protein